MRQDEQIIEEYSVLGDDLYYHHTLTPPSGRRYCHEPGAHTQHELLYLVSGELSYVIEGETYHVTEGDMIFVAPNEIHTLDISGDKPYERIVLLFNMDILHGMMHSLGSELRAFSRDGKNELHIIKSDAVRAHCLDRILKSITESDIDPKYKKLDIISGLIRFVIEIDRLISESRTAPQKPDKRDPLVTAVTEYVDTHIGERIRLDDIADKLFISKSTLSHRFTALMNVSVSRYVTMKKMYHARELMRSGLGARAAAEAVGYENYASFFYSFKEIMKRSPTSVAGE